MGYPTPLRNPLEPQVALLARANVRLRWLCAIRAAAGLAVGIVVTLATMGGR